MPGAQHRTFDQGVTQDEASFLLPEGAVYSSKNMLYDKIGVVRKRGGLTGLGSTTTYNGDHAGFLQLDSGLSQAYSYGKTAQNVSAINISTGAYTLLGSGPFVNLTLAQPDTGRPFQHYGFLMWPNYSYDGVTFPVTGPLAVAGADGSVSRRTFSTPGTCLLTAGDKRIPMAVANFGQIQVGQIVFAYYNASINAYIGRITAIPTTTSFEVYPTPTVTGTCTVVEAYNAFDAMMESLGGGGTTLASGKVGMSFQGRVMIGNCAVLATRLEQYPRRVYFSATLLEQDTAATPPVYTGAIWLSANAFPDFNYFDIPGSDAITAMSPTGYGDAVIFSAYRAFRVTGNLSTQFGTTQSITWAVREIPNSVGCMSERSMQRTPRGIIFAHDSGVYLTDGNSMQPLMYRRIANEWRRLVSGSNFKIYGSALVAGNHYYICGTSGGTLWGWMLNLDTLAWGSLLGKTSAPASWILNSSMQDPANPSKVWGLKWWDQSSSAPSMTGGQLVALDQMFFPTSSNRSDSDGTLVNFEVVTRPYTEDSPTLQKSWEKATVEYKNIGGASPTVTPAAVLDSAEIPAGGTNYFLPRQDVYTVTAATNATPIVVTCGSHDIKVDSWVHLVNVGGNTNANGIFRVQAVGATTVTLMGSYGNAAYTSGGTIQNLDQRDFELVAVQQGAQSNNAAMAYRINDTDSGGTAGADEFELYGISHTWADRELHNE